MNTTTLAITLLTAATLLILSQYARTQTPTQTRNGPELLDDELPTQADRMTLEERKEKARQRGLQPGGKSDTNDDNPASETANFDTKFDWGNDTGTDFSDVGGMDSLIQEIRNDIIVPIKDNPERAAELGVTPSNILFHGPPGTGKTFMAEALATELELPFASLSGADVQSKWINESAGQVNTLFSEAKQIAEEAGGAVIFIDELDSVLASRSGDRNSHEEDTKVVNEFLRHLQDTTENDVVVIGATNRLDALDEAGIRSGRFDKKFKVGKPDLDARKNILEAQLRGRPHSLTEDEIERAAQVTQGVVAADLELLVKEAAKDVLVSGDTEITGEHLLSASQQHA